jgi:hypothetical protein
MVFSIAKINTAAKINPASADADFARAEGDFTRAEVISNNAEAGLMPSGF